MERIQYTPYAGVIKVERIGIVKVLQPVATHWIDSDTGEIMSVKEFKEYGIAVPAQHRYGLRMLRQEHVLNSVRPEVREFARFLMLMRNKNGGFVRSMDELMTAYAVKHDRLSVDQIRGRRKNLKKMLVKLSDVGILANERILRPLFMKLGSTDAEAVFSEDASFHRNLKVKSLPGCSIDERAAQQYYLN